VALIVKRYADAAGLDVDSLSGHSLRAGFITSAADNRASISRIMEVSRHRDPRSVETYVRRADRYNDHAGDGFL
jgi:integrase